MSQKIVENVTYVFKQDVSLMTKPELLSALKRVVAEKQELTKGLDGVESAYVTKTIAEMDGAITKIRDLLDKE